MSASIQVSALYCCYRPYAVFRPALSVFCHVRLSRLSLKLEPVKYSQSNKVKQREEIQLHVVKTHQGPGQIKKKLANTHTVNVCVKFFQYSWFNMKQSFESLSFRAIAAVFPLSVWGRTALAYLEIQVLRQACPLLLNILHLQHNEYFLL